MDKTVEISSIRLTLSKKEAKLRYDKDEWQNHLAESDHIKPASKVFEEQTI